jgi:hypothetical protein
MRSFRLERLECKTLLVSGIPIKQTMLHSQTHFVEDVFEPGNVSVAWVLEEISVDDSRVASVHLNVQFSFFEKLLKMLGEVDLSEFAFSVGIASIVELPGSEVKSSPFPQDSSTFPLTCSENPHNQCP